MIEPSDLKRLAEYMYKGANVEIVRNATVWIEKKVIYRPHTTNAEQCLELMEGFRPSVDWINKELCQVIINKKIKLMPLSSIQYEGRGKTLNEAVTNAAIAAIKE